MWRSVLLLIGICSVVLFSCQKWQDNLSNGDPRLTHPYCNDPAAVNYNWGFPGKPDSTTCYYPTDVFKGNYLYNDSVYLPDDSLAYVKQYTLQVNALDYTKMTVIGFCGSNHLSFTAGKYAIATADTNAVKGQTFCRTLDTLSGTLTHITNIKGDTIWMGINFTVVSDTGSTTHKGTARKI
jgi:hypothetical protein